MSLTSYSSLAYCFIFLPLVIIFYAITPKKIKWLPLLISSYIFFWLVSGKLLAYLLFTTACVYLTGLCLSFIREECDRKCSTLSQADANKIVHRSVQKQRAVLLFAILVQLAMLVIFKYLKFFCGNINGLLAYFGGQPLFEIPNFIAPIGISFYSLQAISYICDVYRRKIQADKNFLRLALFMSFFPQIMEGPICRYSDTAQRLYEADHIKFENLKLGLQRILFGLFKKMVIADRLNPLVKTVFNNYQDFGGSVIVVAAVAFTVQLYMEFSGTMDIVIGTAEIFGVKLPENFQRPFFSKSITEFWQRWHFTLGTWFKDYIYYPISMSPPFKKMTKRSRKMLGNFYGPMLISTIALFCVWLCNGLWHGAGWKYIFFGMFHFTLMTCGNLIKPVVRKIHVKLGINSENAVYKGLQILRTFILVCLGELFFRANGLLSGFEMTKKIVIDFSPKAIYDGTLLSIGLDAYDWLVVLIGLMIIFVVSVINETGVSVRLSLDRKPLPVRWACLIALIFCIVIFGAYGGTYIPVDPIYAGF